MGFLHRRLKSYQKGLEDGKEQGFKEGIKFMKDFLQENKDLFEHTKMKEVRIIEKKSDRPLIYFNDLDYHTKQYDIIYDDHTSDVSDKSSEWISTTRTWETKNSPYRIEYKI